jgi:hypothetical protein
MTKYTRFLRLANIRDPGEREKPKTKPQELTEGVSAGILLTIMMCSCIGQFKQTKKPGTMPG